MQEIKATNVIRLRTANPRKWSLFAAFNGWCKSVGIDTNKAQIGVWYEAWEAFFFGACFVLCLSVNSGVGSKPNLSYGSLDDLITNDNVAVYLYYSFEE
jgi:hypothetical protein